MRYVILRDDDTNALTPIECLEELYRPFLERELPVNLAVIPEVATNAVTPEGKPEGFLFFHEPGNIDPPSLRSHLRFASTRQVGAMKHRSAFAQKLRRDKTSNIEHRMKGQGSKVEGRGIFPHEPGKCGIESAAVNQSAMIRELLPLPKGEGRGEGEGRSSSFLVHGKATVSIGTNSELVNYLRENPLYHVAQHGCHHDCFEFDRDSRAEIAARLEQGTRALVKAGFPHPTTFVAPHDKFSRVSYREVAKRFPVISSGWFEWRRLPVSWWPEYLEKKARGTPHWSVNGTRLLSHPGCLLSAHRDLSTMLDQIIRSIQSRQLTVLVTHWWEYFPAGKPNEEFIRVLHRTADYLASQNDIRVISFADLIERRLQLN